MRISDRLTCTDWHSPPASHGRQNTRHGHAVAGRLDHHFVGGQRLLPKLPEPCVSCRSGLHAEAGRLPISPPRQSAVGIDPVKRRFPAPRGRSSGAAGDTTTRIRAHGANRASRRGGQLRTQLHGSSYASAFRTFVLPVPSSRMVAPYAEPLRSQLDVGTGLLIPVTNVARRGWQSRRTCAARAVAWHTRQSPHQAAA